LSLPIAVQNETARFVEDGDADKRSSSKTQDESKEIMADKSNCSKLTETEVIIVNCYVTTFKSILKESNVKSAD